MRPLAFVTFDGDRCRSCQRGSHHNFCRARISGVETVMLLL